MVAELINQFQRFQKTESQGGNREKRGSLYYVRDDSGDMLLQQTGNEEDVCPIEERISFYKSHIGSLLHTPTVFNYGFPFSFS